MLLRIETRKRHSIGSIVSSESQFSKTISENSEVRDTNS